MKSRATDATKPGWLSRPGLNKGWSSLTGVFLLGAGLIAVNILAGFVPLRLDITEEGLYTLSDGSRQIIEKLEDPVTVKYYFSESIPDIPVAIKSYAQKVRELLQEYRNAGDGKVTLEIFDPRPDTDEEEWAKRYGVSAVRLPSGAELFHGMVILSGGKEANVPFFDPRRERFLEYDVSEALINVKGGTRKVIGLMSGLPVMGGGMGPGGQPQGEWAFLSQLRRTFTVQNIAQNVAEIPEQVNLMMVVHPKGVTPGAQYALDQYLMRGGRMIVFLDPLSRVDGPAGQMGQVSQSDLAPLLSAWKIKYDKNNVVGDPLLATRVNTPNAGVITYPVWLSLSTQYIDRNSVVTSQLDDITLIDSGSLEKMEGSEYTFTPLLTSSPNAGVLPGFVVQMTPPTDLTKNLKPDAKPHVLAGLVSGKLRSAFPGGPLPPPPGEDGKPKPAPAPAKGHLVEASQETSVLVVADADFFADRFSVQVANFFGQQIVQPINDNMNFVLNAVEFMAGGQELIHIRSRGQLSRPFEKVAEIQLQAQEEYQQQEKALADKLDEVRKRLAELQSKEKEGGKTALLSPAQAEAIRKFRMEEQRVSRALRDVRKVLRQDIERLDNTLLVLNLLVVPALVAGMGFFVIIRRSRRLGGKA